MAGRQWVVQQRIVGSDVVLEWDKISVLKRERGRGGVVHDTGDLNTTSPWTLCSCLRSRLSALRLPPLAGNHGKWQRGSFRAVRSCGLCPNPSSAGVSGVTRRCRGTGAEVGQDEGGVPKRSSAVELHFLLWFRESVVREADKCTTEGRILHCVCTRGGNVQC